jgi:hypothetical protein
MSFDSTDLSPSFPFNVIALRKHFRNSSPSTDFTEMALSLSALHSGLSTRYVYSFAIEALDEIPNACDCKRQLESQSSKQRSAPRRAELKLEIGFAALQARANIANSQPFMGDKPPEVRFLNS